MTYLQETRLRPRTQTAECRAALEDEAHGFIGALRRNGQIWGEPLLAWSDGDLHIVVLTPYRDSLSAEHHSPWVEGALDQLVAHCVGSVVWSARGSDHGSRSSAADWSKCNAFFVFTHAFDDSSPVNAGEDGEPAPLYLLAIDQQLRQDLGAWMDAYKHHDHIWLDSRELEGAAHAQLSQIDSELSRRGRALAAELERELGRPTYYYLHRYDALPVGEESRPCPSCGGSWARCADSALRGLARFDFQCDECRLVSYRGVNVVDEADG